MAKKRYIDTNLLVEKLNNEISHARTKEAREEAEKIKDWICEQPISNFQCEVYGKWLSYGRGFKCSNCGAKPLWGLDESAGGHESFITIRSKCCPNCGAKMR